MAERVVVVGAGVGGLVTAALAASQGFDVTLVEAAATPGGKLRAIAVDDTPVDAGPTVFTLRDVFDDIFAACGRSLDDHVTLTPLTTLARHFWSDGTRLDLFADPRESEDAIGVFAGSGAVTGYRNFRAEAARIFNIIDRPFLRSAKTGPLGLCRNIGLGRIGDLLAIRPYESMWTVLGEHFADPRLRQLFARYATYCGSDPFRTPATLLLVAHVEASGVWRIEGGMHRLAAALAGLAERSGCHIRYGTPVAEVTVSSGRASGVILSGGEHLAADRVVVNADPAALGDGRFGRAAARSVGGVAQRNRSLSAMVWLSKGATRGHQLDHHNVMFSNDYGAEFDALKAGRIPSDPSVYLCNQRGETSQIIVNAPANGDTHHYSEKEIDLCRNQMLASLARCGVTLSPDHLSVLTPNDFNSLNPSTGGALYGRASHGWAASFLRQGTRTRMPGLYCVGGSTHPGAGVPMAALSGRLAVECLLSDRVSTVRSRPAAIAGGTSTQSATTGPMA